jgi:salicylate hydroxylase
MQRLARREEELYHIADPAEIAQRNAVLRQKRGADAAEFPPEQERLYGYDAEAVLHG